MSEKKPKRKELLRQIEDLKFRLSCWEQSAKEWANKSEPDNSGIWNAWGQLYRGSNWEPKVMQLRGGK